MFPTLTKLAQLHLSSSAASVPVECMFGTAGLVASGKRSKSNLSTEKLKLHRICFVYDKVQAAFLTVTLTLLTMTVLSLQQLQYTANLQLLSRL